MPKPTLKRASSRFAEIARKTGGVFVFATRDATLPNRESVSAEVAGYAYANHHCNKCEATFAFPKAKGAHPFCVVCGTGDVEVQEDVKPNIAPDEELSYLTCAGCGTINTFHKALAGVGNHIHCAACGTDMVSKAELETTVAADDEEDESAPEGSDSDSDETPDIDDMELLDLEDDLPEDGEGAEEQATTTNEDTVGVKSDGKPLGDDADAARGPGAPDSATTDGQPANPGIEPPTQNPGAVEPSVTKAASEDDEEDEDEDEGDDEEEDENDEGDDAVTATAFKDMSPDRQAKYLLNRPKSKYHVKTKPKSKAKPKPKLKKKVKSDFSADEGGDGEDVLEDGEGETMDMDLVDVHDDADTPVESVAFFYGDKMVMLAARNQIIATLSEAGAGEYKGMLQSEQFRMAVAHTIETEGLKKAIATYKFVPSKVTVKISKVVSAKVEAALKDQKTKVQAGADTYAEQFQHSLDIAAAGYAGNFWRNRQDPLKTALIAELTSLGIRKSDKLVDKIFAMYSVAQFRDVISVARDLSKKPVEALNALAETIDLVKYSPTVRKKAVAEESSDEESVDEDMGEDDEDQDDGEFATATPIESVTASTSNFSSYKTPELRRILGGSTSHFQ